MSDTFFKKKPAFFRVTSAEMFFEADAEVNEYLQLDEAVEKEIDGLIKSIALATSPSGVGLVINAKSDQTSKD